MAKPPKGTKRSEPTPANRATRAGRLSPQSERKNDAASQGDGIRFLRLELHESPPPNTEAFAPIFVDLAIDSHHRKVGRWLAFGWRGHAGKRDVECYPFVIDWQGRIDFGSACANDGDRYGSTDLPSIRITEGELIRFDFGNEGKADYRIQRLHDLKVLVRQR